MKTELKLTTGAIEEINLFKPGWKMPDGMPEKKIIFHHGVMKIQYIDGHPMGVL